MLLEYNHILHTPCGPSYCNGVHVQPAMQSSPKRAKIKLFQVLYTPPDRPVDQPMHPSSDQRACFLLLLSPWTNTYVRSRPGGGPNNEVESRERIIRSGPSCLLVGVFIRSGPSERANETKPPASTAAPCVRAFLDATCGRRDFCGVRGVV